MNHDVNLIDELCFVHAELQPCPLLASNVLDLSVTVPIDGSRRALTLASPFFVREWGARLLGANWPVLCGLLRRFGVSVFGTVADFQDLPLGVVPLRLGRTNVNEALDSTELITADAFEIECWDRQLRRWGWSSEWGASKLPAFVSAIRRAAGGDTPVGIGLPANCQASDWQRAVEARADFVSLVCSNSIGAIDLRTLVSLSNRSEVGRPPTLFAAPVTSIEQAVKLLALGASAVCIDEILRPLIAKMESPGMSVAGSGMLSGFHSPIRKSSMLPEVEQLLMQLETELRHALWRANATRLSELTKSCLRCSSESCARITGVQLA